MCNKTNTTSIGAMAVDGLTRELICHCHPQPDKHAHAIVFSIQHQQVDIPNWMQLTTLSVTGGQKADKNNSYKYYFNVMLVVVC